MNFYKRFPGNYNTASYKAKPDCKTLRQADVPLQKAVKPKAVKNAQKGKRIT